MEGKAMEELKSEQKHIVILPQDGKEIEDEQVPFEDLISELRY